ncbi:DNA glycosylase AlkZ-like family protein [Sinomonas mesophila]|uniref:DNA glycosylase AlkZ-like family protein n=1 Tax=Sinomonas mesophila TaxID=1531955 RepID=UPI0009864A03|nr:crosslink repair DNA glycosylase YcaQ family protein [Sinomonas mesophila]
MDWTAVVRQRLATQRLTAEPLASAGDTVRLLLGVQAQEREHALSSLVLRSRVPSIAAARTELDAGSFVRTHILRQTWHFVAAEDLRWLLDLTSPRVEAKEMAYVRKFVPEPRHLDRALDLMGSALAGGRLSTRKELGALMETHGLPGAGEAVGHVLMIAELRGLICGGPIRGREHTYGLVADLIDARPDMPGDGSDGLSGSREASLATLGMRFFAGHGPASAKDLARWATLTAVDAKAAVAGARSLGELEEVQVDGIPHWFSPAMAAEPVAARLADAFLFPVYDEAVLSYPLVTFPSLGDAPRVDGVEASWGWAVLDATRVGLWKRTVHSDRVTVETRLAPSLGRGERRRVAAAVDRLAAANGLPAEHVEV